MKTTNSLAFARLLMIQSILTMLLAFPFANAQAQGQVQVQRQQINSYYYQGDQINLNQQLGLAQLIRQGKKILSVSVKAQATQFDSKIVLKVNGQRIQAQMLSQSLSLKTFAVPYLSQGDQITFKVKGGAFVKVVKAEYKSRFPGGGQGQAQVLKAVINKQFRGNQTLPIKRLVQDYSGARLQGKKVLKVIVKASSRNGHAKAQLLINGSPVGYEQTIPMNEQRLVFSLPAYGRNVIGQDIRSIQVQVIGNVHVTMVGIKVKKGLGQQGGGQHNQDSVQVQVNRTFRGSERVSLQSLMGHNRPNGQKQVESVTITAKGRGDIRIAGAGQSQGSMNVNSRYAQGQTVRVSGFATLQDLKLRVNGTLTIESIRIKFKRSRH